MVDGELFGYLVLATDTERNIKWVRRFWGTRVVLRTGVIYATSLRSGLVTHVAWLYLEFPKPHGEIIQQFRGLHSIDPLRVDQELHSCQRVRLMVVKPTMWRPSRHRAPRPQGPMASSCWRPK